MKLLCDGVCRDAGGRERMAAHPQPPFTVSAFTSSIGPAAPKGELQALRPTRNPAPSRTTPDLRRCDGITRSSTLCGSKCARWVVDSSAALPVHVRRDCARHAQALREIPLLRRACLRHRSHAYSSRAKTIQFPRLPSDARRHARTCDSPDARDGGL